MKVRLPDDTELELADGATGEDAARAIGEGLARAALAVKVDGELRDLGRAAARRRADRDRHAEEPRGARADPPRRGARARHGRARALPRREDLDRPADRHRLLLRLRVPRGREGLGGRLRAHRAEDARAREGGRAVRARGRARSGRAQALHRGGRGLQGRADRGPDQGRRGDGVALPQRPVHRPLPRPARAHDEDGQGVQARIGRRRVLARRLRPADADARSTARRSSRRTTSPSTSSGSSRRARATTASSGKELDLFLFSELSPGLAVLAAAGHGDLERADRHVADRERATAATAR